MTLLHNLQSLLLLSVPGVLLQAAPKAHGLVTQPSPSRASLVTSDLFGRISPLRRTGRNAMSRQLQRLSRVSATGDDDHMDVEALLEYLDEDNVGEGVTFQEYREQQRREKYLRDSPIFQRCSAPDVSRIAKAMILENISKGKVLVSQGDTGSSMYFLKEGSLNAVRKANGTEEILTSYSKEGEVFGELALLFGQPRAASIVASTDSVIYRLDKAAFLDSVVESPIWDTAKGIILKKYKVQRLRDILPKVRLDEILGLVQARLFGRFSSKRLVGTMRTFSLGVAAALTVKYLTVKTAMMPLVYLSFGLLAYMLN